VKVADDADVELNRCRESRDKERETEREREKSIRSCSVTMAVGIKSVYILRRHLPRLFYSTLKKNSLSPMGILSVILFFHFWQIETTSGDKCFNKTVKDSLIFGREKKNPPNFKKTNQWWTVIRISERTRRLSGGS